MPGSHSHLKSFLSCLTLTFASVLLTVTAGAQTPTVPASTVKTGAIKAEAITAGPVSDPATIQASAAKNASDAPDSANAKTDSAKIESAEFVTAPVEAAVIPPADPPSSAKATTAATAAPPPAPAAAAPACTRTIHADVVALAQPYMLNRLGASMPNALIYALRSDVMSYAPPNAANVQLRPWKRARPIVLRVNQGDCLEITLTNFTDPKLADPTNDKNFIPSSTPPVSLHVQGMQLVTGIKDDGSFVGVNDSSLVAPNASKVYTLFAQHEGTFLLYSEGDSNTTGQQLFQGLFGAVNVQPAGAEWYRSQVTQKDLELASYNARSLPTGMKITPAGCATGPLPKTCTLTTVKNGVTTNTPVVVASGGYLQTKGGQPLIDYAAVYPAGNPRAGQPILKMLDSNNKIVHSDLTAIITGPNAGRFPGTTGVGNLEPKCNQAGQPGVKVDPLFCQNPALPDRKQPYREVTVVYHEVFPSASQAFNVFWDANNELFQTVVAARDDFAINYGTGGIGAEIYANRIGVGPMANCVDCKYEEFFLSAWAVGDPATVVDVPANYVVPNPPAGPPCTYNNLTPSDTFLLDNNDNAACLGRTKDDPVGSTPAHPNAGYKATMAFYPDDPSNVYHSYLNDHIKFRILHGGTGVTHVHHQHAHQWLQSPNSSDGSYLDSQFISPGASYTLEMVYNGSGNRNKTLGDSIFHCHFYPHFAEGMWAMWRVHDVFEAGTELDAKGRPKTGSRAYPDAEIKVGTPIPAIVPLPTMPMPLMPSPVFIENGQVVYGTPANPDPTGQNVQVNPGYPFFIPGIAGFRPPHPPLDFAPDNANPGQLLDGGLPRHVNTGGTTINQLMYQANKNDWSKDFVTLNAKQLPEDGTNVEKVAMAFNGKRCNPTFLPDGSDANPFGPQNYPECGADASKANFILNGLPNGPQHGAPFADPFVGDDGKSLGDDKDKRRIYKAAAIQMDAQFNSVGWHYQQQRLLTLWKDVTPTLNKARDTEPLFFRANSGDYIEYWHTNLVPNYYQKDAFQVRTPTDILGQHIHLVKFDVTSSDGAGNGWNYEDGTFSPDEVKEIIEAIKKNGPDGHGSWTHCTGCSTNLRAAQPPPAEICSGTPPLPSQCKEDSKVNWWGAQTTIQRWYADPFFDNDGKDNTIRTVFTHDHFGPSTHQQAGLYAGLLVEPRGSSWTSNDGKPFYTRTIGGTGDGTDGGPTSWQARIIAGPGDADSYREFALEFQDFTLAYAKGSGKGTHIPGVGAPINPPPVPTLISTGGQPPPGTQTVNYLNAPIPWRVGPGCDLSRAFDSTCQQLNLPVNGDPGTPLLRAYENDKVQVRVLVGAHTFSHFFTIGGPKWLFEPSWTNSGYRSSQGMGLSEHFEMLFNVPPSSIAKVKNKCPRDEKDKDKKDWVNCVDYLYSPSDDDIGLTNGLWGLLRAYNPTKPFDQLEPLPSTSNPLGSGANLEEFKACPANQLANKKRTFNITAVDAESFVPGGTIVFNSRVIPGETVGIQSLGFMYVFSDDIDPVTHKLKGPVEPLILRANAGDCIVVNLSNGIDPNAAPFQDVSAIPWPQAPFNEATINPSENVGLHPQLLSYDGAEDSGINIGYNVKKNQAVAKGGTITYNWYAGNIGRDKTGKLTYTPVEFGSLNLIPTDPIMQHIWSLFGGMVIEPVGSTWKCDAKDSNGNPIPGGVPCEPTPGFDPSKVQDYTRASATVTPVAGGTFREFVAMVNEDLRLNQNNRSAINYRTEPTYFRYGTLDPDDPIFPPGPPFAPTANLSGPNVPPSHLPTPTGDNNCALSNALPLPGNNPAFLNPQTPIFSARAGTPVRFRLMHPQGTGTAQVFTINGHVWQREPYTDNSTVIGDNLLSQWIGSHDSHGGTDHYDIVIDRAGGQYGIPGDYLYTTFVPNQNIFGSWGIFRVLDKYGKQVASNPMCVQSPMKLVPQPKPHEPKSRDANSFIRQPFGKEP